MKKILSLITLVLFLITLVFAFSSCKWTSVSSNKDDAAAADEQTSLDKPDTDTLSYASTTSEYYPDTKIPDYTYVTGIEQKESPFYADNGLVVYSYRNTKHGEFQEVVDYMRYLEENGWSRQEEKKDDSSISWYYVKNSRLMLVAFNAVIDEITIIVQ